MTATTFCRQQMRYRTHEAAEWEKVLGEMRTIGAPNFLVRQVELSIDRIKNKPLRTICGAKTRKGHSCQAKSEPDRRRCRLHGGLSTGPKTPEGKARALAGLRAGHMNWRAACGHKQSSESHHGG